MLAVRDKRDYYTILLLQFLIKKLVPVIILHIFGGNYNIKSPKGNLIMNSSS